MPEFDNTNTFTLFVNDKQGNEKRPDRSGTLNVDGVEYYIDGWIKQGKNGPFLSGKIKLKAERAEAVKTKIGPDIDGDIPF